MPHSDKNELKAYQKAYRLKNHARLLLYLEDHPCVDCGEADPVVLEFDHRDASTKINEIGRMVTSSHASWKKIMIEIEKCDVRCANCHRRRTYHQRKFFCKSMAA